MGRPGHRASTIISSAFAALFSVTANAVPSEILVGSLGDSISAAFNAQRYGDNREISWASGTHPSINSHAKRLAALKGATLKVRNEALTGSVVTDLDHQITRLLRSAPQHITITIGANDMCSWPRQYGQDVADFEAELDKQISRLLAALPGVKIYMAAVPDLYNLWQIAHVQNGCQGRWDSLNLCRPLLAADLSPEERYEFVQRWQDTNAAIDRVASKYAQAVIHDDSIAATKFTWNDVTPLDCFHPSPDGQKLLAELSWRAVIKHLTSETAEGTYDN